MKQYPFVQIQELIDPVNQILILLSKGVNFDQVSASLALYLSLKKAGKQVSIVSPEPMRVEFSRLVGVDKVTDKLSGADLSLTFDYPLEGIEKVTSSETDGKLNLMIKIKPGNLPISKEQIIFSPAGASGDVIITLGVRKYEGLGKIYSDNKEFIEQKPIINIDNNSQNSGFGKLNLVDSDASSLTEIVASLIAGVNLPADADIGSNIIQGLEVSTNNFQSLKANANTFEAAAFALRIGGRRSGSESVSTSTSTPIKEENVPEEKKEETVVNQNSVEVSPSPDWFEPKIYKGSTLP